MGDTWSIVTSVECAAVSCSRSIALSLASLVWRSVSNHDPEPLKLAHHLSERTRAPKMDSARTTTLCRIAACAIAMWASKSASWRCALSSCSLRLSSREDELLAEWPAPQANGATRNEREDEVLGSSSFGAVAVAAPTFRMPLGNTLLNARPITSGSTRSFYGQC
jgi:hypothetical protein